MKTTGIVLSILWFAGLANASPKNCTNFSGTWRGQCSVDQTAGEPRSYEKSLKITQAGCDEISIDSGTMVMNSRTTLTQETPKVSIVTTDLKDWSWDFTETRSFTTIESYSRHDVVRTTTRNTKNASMHIEDGQLITVDRENVSHVSHPSTNDVVTTIVTTCTFDKVAE